MGTMTPEKLLQLWKLEKISAEMAIGHVLQNLIELQTAHEARTITIYDLQANVDGLIAHTGIKPRSRIKPRPKGKNRPLKSG